MEPIYITGHRNPDTDSIVAAISYAMLKNALGNHAGAARDMVLMNAGVALYTLGVVNDIAAGIEKAREVIASGAALRKMNEYVECTQQFKTEDSPA